MRCRTVAVLLGTMVLFAAACTEPPPTTTDRCQDRVPLADLSGCDLSGEDLSVDGETGAVYRGLLSVTTTRPDDHIRKVGEWRKTA